MSASGSTNPRCFVSVLGAARQWCFTRLKNHVSKLVTCFVVSSSSRALFEQELPASLGSVVIADVKGCCRKPCRPRHTTGKSPRSVRTLLSHRAARRRSTQAGLAASAACRRCTFVLKLHENGQAPVSSSFAPAANLRGLEQSWSRRW